MASQWVNVRDYKFVVHELFRLGRDVLGKGPFAEHDAETVNMVIDAAAKFAEAELAAVYPDEVRGKSVGAQFREGRVYAPEAYHKLWKLYAEGGWLTLSEPAEEGGQGFPKLVGAACNEAFVSCNHAFTMYETLTHGAAAMVRAFCSEELKKRYLAKLLDGTFSGTMCLTEPGAGSDVGALKTSARRNPDGTYSITGTKSFISGGDHDLAKNVVHLVLARIEGDPPGTKGISIFLVPRNRVGADGSVGESNDVTTGNIEHKMGIHGNATCTLNFGENGRCVGHLIGQEREGIKIMFFMMNEARQGVGLMGVALANAGYLHALSYAKERLQGSNLLAPAAPGKQVPIIQHPDVRRMLLLQKAITEGIRMLCLYCYYAMDREAVATDEEEKARWKGAVEIFTPVVKAYCTDMGFVVNDLAVQTYGGYGYCREYPVEQLLRDQRINSIYEGTNGIQALDLLGRKLGMKGGMVFMGVLQEMGAIVEQARKTDAFPAEAAVVEEAMNALMVTATEFAGMMKSNPAVPLLAASDFLRAFGDTICGWLHLWSALTAKRALAEAGEEREKLFYTGKIEAARFFVNRITALVPARCEVLRKDETSAMRIPEEAFAV